MCKCHYYNKETNKIERVQGEFSLNTCNEGDVFRFAHESFPRIAIRVNFTSKEVFAPPANDDYSGMDEKGQHTFHTSFKAIFGEK